MEGKAFLDDREGAGDGKAAPTKRKAAVIGEIVVEPSCFGLIRSLRAADTGLHLDTDLIEGARVAGAEVPAVGVGRKES